MAQSLINPNDPLERQNEKLLKISEALMRRVEQSTDASGAAYAQFQRAALLEEEVRARTRDLERALDLLNESNAKLAEANAETEAARSNLANAIETVQEGFALFNTDDQLVMCNSRFGMHMPDIRSSLKPGLPFTQYVNQVSQSRFLSLPDAETPDHWAQRRMERHKDDHVIFNVRMTWNRWVQVSEHRTPDGGTVILQTDVTDIMRLERQERERMLDDQARLIRATLEHLNQGVCIFDSRARLVGWNQRVGAMLSIPIGRFRIGIGFNALFERFRDEITFTPEVTPQKIEDWVASQHARPPLSFEMMQGPSKTLAVFAEEMPDKGFVISFTDVSAERAAVRAIYHANETLEQRVMERTLELEDALSEAERANDSKSRFVAAASHDLLQPLSAAKLYVSSVEADENNAQTKTILDKANRALLSVENILEALLDISKLDSGQASVHITPVPVNIVLQQLRDELAPVARQKGLDLRIVPTKAVVSSDATYLRRILQNLITNAIRYTESGKVVVGARWRENSVRLEVWDTGPGIPEEQQDLIFREFQRLNATASAAEGMGLGLAIVERACALLSHPLRLVSTVGKGTGFLVELPLATKEFTPVKSNLGSARVKQKDLRNLIVLLIENDVELRNALTISLEKWAVDVISSPSGQEAMALLEEIGVAPDVILADYQLDHGELGTNVVTQITQRFGNIPACIITANRSNEVVDACTSKGLHLMHKPIDPNSLRSYLSKVGAV
ncbi:hybrid sensor histidine kinase/response regulator [Actibacterium lipolyticum]|uniref:histidine kinase n=1 Tax=Actibacterium lipolyticum TaxID=1524263 RepID=A0A238JWH7_9RHOB|nr:PAS-domain containing protein [Actibacterium lipolyticum]SMX34547.1 Autoinducer 2 sensor kinase/phosphatase LuxQ [Actibacterium lipolyticum]